MELLTKKVSRTKKVISLFVLILILLSGFTVACNIMPSKDKGNNDSFAVYIKEDGLYCSYLNNGEETKIHDGNSFEYPLISKSGDYIAYTKEDSLYIYNMKEKNYEEIANEMNHYNNSYDWIDDTTIVYGSTKKPGFVLLNMLTKDKVEHMDEYYYTNFKASNNGIIYGIKMSKWTTGKDDFASNDGIVEIDVNKYDEQNKRFGLNIIIRGRRSTDEIIGNDPVIWDITDDGKYIHIVEKFASASLSADGIGIGVYDVEEKTHTELTNITTLQYKNHLAINPKDNNLIGLIEGIGREMIENKEVVLLDINGDKTYKRINFMEKDLVAMTPSFTLDGEKLLYSASKSIKDNRANDFDNVYEQWESQPHNIYEYTLKTSKVKKITEGEHFDFMPINISKDEILFNRYKGNEFYSLVRLVNGKENIIVDNIMFSGGIDNHPFGFYGHIDTEKGMDIFINKEGEPHSGDGSTKQDKDNKVTTNKSNKDVLDQISNRDFIIQEEILSNADNEKVVEFGKAFVNLFNGAVSEEEKVSFEKYISNKNLGRFTDKILELTQRQELQGGHGVIYGLDNQFKQFNLRKHPEGNLVYLELPFEFEGSGMACKMLITSEDKSLKIVDFYFGSKDGVDTFATGHPAVRKVKDPNLWDDEEWVKGVFDKLESLEEELGL